MRGLIFLVVSFVAIDTPTARTIGFQQLTIPDGAGKPLAVAVWYPSDGAAISQDFGPFRQTVSTDGHVSGRALPLILISHGSGGSSALHYDTALALASRGFVVAALTHTGDNYMDQSYAGNRKDLTDRPRQAIHVLDYMLSQWSGHDNLDPARVGIFGFSLGGFTAIVVSGGTPDLSRLQDLCSSRPKAPECLFVKQRRGDMLEAVTGNPTWPHDPRVKAAVVAAPAVSYLFGPESLKGVTIPMQLWRASDDDQVPDEWNTAIVRAELPRTPEEHVVPGAGHFIFVASCSETLAKQVPRICTDAPGVDRAAFHRSFNNEVVAFFKQTLGK